MCNHVILKNKMSWSMSPSCSCEEFMAMTKINYWRAAYALSNYKMVKSDKSPIGTVVQWKHMLISKMAP